MEISILLAKEIAKLFLIMFMGYAIVKLSLIHISSPDTAVCIRSQAAFAHLNLRLPPAAD